MPDNINAYIQGSTKVGFIGLWSKPIRNFGGHFGWLFTYFCCKLNFVLFHVKVMPAKNGCKNQIGFHHKVYDSQMCVPAKSGGQEKKRLPIKISCHTKLATSQELKPVKKRQDLNGCYPKLAVKIGCQKSVYQLKEAATKKQLPAKCRWKPKVAARLRGLPAKRGCQLQQDRKWQCLHAQITYFWRFWQF